MKRDQWMGLMIGFLGAMLLVQLAGCGDVPNDVTKAEEAVNCTVTRGFPPLGLGKHIDTATAYWAPGSPLPAAPATAQLDGNTNKLERYMSGFATQWNAPGLVRGNWEFLLWTSPNPPVPGAPGVVGGACYSYMATTDGFAQWPDGSQTVLPQWGYKVFPAASNPDGIGWIEQLDLPIGGGTQLTVKGKVHK